ncbi:hypothetical protein [Marmoricola sp. Leaf446]|uniref:hypothetical protein n=1 Tax=Marmoricola sp. Leaf446 TaxID=1736379 RepID=UPI0012E3B4B1|nr:hypothetical protein [Marmoricola sp. Leaf446]
MTFVLVLAGAVCALLAVGAWYDLRHRARGEITSIPGPRAMRVEQQTWASRVLGPGDGP